LDEKPTRSVKISSPSLTVQPKFSSSAQFAQPKSLNYLNYILCSHLIIQTHRSTFIRHLKGNRRARAENSSGFLAFFGKRKVQLPKNRNTAKVKEGRKKIYKKFLYQLVSVVCSKCECECLCGFVFECVCGCKCVCVLVSV